MVVHTKLYDLLEVSPTASDEEIKRSFYRLSMKYHPDKATGNEELYKQITAAYDILKDKKKRAAYDMLGLTEVPQPFNSFTFKMPMSGNRGSDIHIPVTLTLEEVYNGCERSITGGRRERCKVCSGSGGKKASTCKKCGGSGIIVKSINSKTQTVQTCKDCSGTGKLIDQFCESCNGERSTVCKYHLDVSIPAGSTGSVVIKNEGNWGVGGSGDLFIDITIERHPRFTLRKNDILYAREITLAEAMLGFSFSLVYLDGSTLNISVDPVVQPSHPFYHLANMGINGGSLLMKFEVVIPSLSEELVLEFLHPSPSTLKRIRSHPSTSLKATPT